LAVAEALTARMNRGYAMTDPLARAASRAPATLGEGCVSRYDPDALTGENGAEFAGAAELWQQLQAAPQLDPGVEAASEALCRCE
jgi:hypothetical protein